MPTSCSCPHSPPPSSSAPIKSSEWTDIVLPANPGPCGIWSLKGRDILCLAVALIYYGVSTDLESLGM